MKYMPNSNYLLYHVMVGLGNAFVYSNFKGPIYLTRRLSSSFTKLRRSSLIRKPPSDIEEHANAVDDPASDRLAHRTENEDKIQGGPQSTEVVDSEMYVSSHKCNASTDDSTRPGASTISAFEISMNYMASDMSKVPSGASSVRLPSGISSIALTNVSMNHEVFDNENKQSE